MTSETIERVRNGVHYVEPSTMDIGDTPDSVIDFITGLRLHIAMLETELVKAECNITPTPSSAAALEALAKLESRAKFDAKSMEGIYQCQQWADTIRHSLARCAEVVTVTINELIRALEGASANTDTDARWRAATCLKEIGEKGRAEIRITKITPPHKESGDE